MVPYSDLRLSRSPGRDDCHNRSSHNRRIFPLHSRVYLDWLRLPAWASGVNLMVEQTERHMGQKTDLVGCCWHFLHRQLDMCSFCEHRHVYRWESDTGHCWRRASCFGQHPHCRPISSEVTMTSL